jgi:hypothetical protein
LIFTDPPMARRLFAHNWDHLTVDGALRRIGLDYEACAEKLAKYRLTARTMLLSAETADRFSAFLSDIWPLLEQKYQDQYQLTLAYLQQELLLSDEPAAFVDIGWHGSLQNCLVKLLKHVRIDKDLGGYYLGTFENPTGMADGFKAQGFLVNNGEPKSIAHLVRCGPSLIELFHSAGHGSVLGYQRAGARIKPLLDQNDVEVQQYQQIIEPLQNQALAFLRDQLARQPEAALHAPDPGLVARMALRVIYAPTPAEATIFGRLQIASDFGGRMKSLTGILEWDLAQIKGDFLPDGYIPIWRPGFQALKQRG